MGSQVLHEEEEESMRQLYLQCIETDPDIILAEIAVPLKEELLQTEAGAELMQGTCEAVVVSSRGAAVTVEKEAFAVGRQGTCDVALVGCLDVSRIQFWVFNLPGGLMVVDGWSCSGTAVQARESDCHELASSKPGSRRAFVVPHGEAVALQVGQQTVSLNPKTCVICIDRPREVELGCGHRAMCAQCVRNTSQCPLCRVPVHRGNVRGTVSACVGATFVGEVPRAPDHSDDA